jgi:hypothetical protein
VVKVAATDVDARKDANNGGQIEAMDQPAPPLPLTEQERLLTRVALGRQPEPVEVAGLSAEARAKLAAQEKDEFEAFFTPPNVETANATD